MLNTLLQNLVKTLVSCTKRELLHTCSIIICYGARGARTECEWFRQQDIGAARPRTFAWACLCCKLERGLPPLFHSQCQRRRYSIPACDIFSAGTARELPRDSSLEQLTVQYCFHTGVAVVFVHASVLDISPQPTHPSRPRV